MSDSLESSEENGDSQRRIEKWRREEWKCIVERRRRAFPNSDRDERGEEPENLTGLALSGGGIRSALFNDGFLQALSHRGMLRYVDFLCSVSGGGYIAGHLASQGDADAKTCFHDDPHRAELGRDPESGRIARDRLPGIGGYLSRPLEFIPAYLWSLFFSLAFYVGLVGIVAVMSALVWRSFDNFLFREIYSETLGLDLYGDELTIAFLPAFGLIALMVVGEITMTLFRLSSRLSRERLMQLHRRFRAVMLLVCVFAMLTSVAIFLGNGKSFVRDGTSSLYLNRYVQYFAIVAGAIQIMVFLGRDRLFKSERGEASGWQRILQQSVTTMLVVTAVFTMVHWMGQEDISDYTKQRDPHLVVGDVKDWPRLVALKANFDQKTSGRKFALTEQETSPYESEVDLKDGKANTDAAKTDLATAGDEKGIEQTKPTNKQPIVEDEGKIATANKVNLNDRVLEPRGSWHKSVVLSKLNLLGKDQIGHQDLSQPPAPGVPTYEDENGKTPQVWTLPTRMVAAAYAYWRTVVDPMDKDAIAAMGDSGASEDAGIVAKIDRLIAGYSQRRRNRIEFLKDFNQDFQTRDFTLFLLTQLKWAANEKQLSKSDRTDWWSVWWSVDSKPSPGSLPTTVKELIDSGRLNLSSSQIEQLTTQLHSRGLSIPDADLSASDQESVFDGVRNAAATNRMVIEGFFPLVVQRQDVASTLVVPPHDHQTRIRWLLGWTMLLFVGLIGGLGPHRVSTVFHFYRRQLSMNFLTPTPNPKQQYGANRLEDVQPYQDGLPYPLVLAAALKPSTFNGSYRVAARPFVFSPKYSGSFEDNEEPIESNQLSFDRNPEKPPLTLADAVTLSGAAVTPLMTQNRWLTIILDFFNTGIGQRVRRTDRTKSRASTISKQPVLMTIAICIAVVWYCAAFLDLRWSILLVLPTTALFCHCWNFQVGSPGWIRSLCFLQETCYEEDFNQNQSFYIADGGYVDYLGVSELLRRRCELIVVSDAGANVGGDSLGTLARMCERASKEQGIRFLDLDHEAPIDFGRLEIDNESRLVHQPFICMRVRYPKADRDEALLVYCQMSITASDPIEIKNIRNLFPSFPDEPTTNQFYNEKQVAAYRTLGYHIGSRFCSEVFPWFNGASSPTDAKGDPSPVSKSGSPRSVKSSTKQPLSKPREFRERLDSGIADPTLNSGSPKSQPLFDVLKERLLTSYRLACYQEITYHKDDIFGEAVWTSSNFAFPSVAGEVRGFLRQDDSQHTLSNYWLKRYESNADLRSAYRTAVIQDINSLGVESDSYCGMLWNAIRVNPTSTRRVKEVNVNRLAAHLTCIAVSCQEIHRGRPNAAFQVGGRGKLIDLCQRIAKVIAESAPDQSDYKTIGCLFKDLDRTIAELIEMERSIFQGGEHVATISFAQCMSTAWGMIARDTCNKKVGPDAVTLFTKQEGVFQSDGVLGMFEQRGTNEPQSTDTFDLITAEVRHQLDVGMREIRLKAIRNGLAKSWYLGFFSAHEMEDFKLPTTPPVQEGQPSVKSESNEVSPKTK